MKIKLSHLVIALAIITLGSYAFTKGAAKSKVGYLHTNSLWEMMPEKKKADTTIVIKQMQLEEFYKQKQEEFQAKWMAYTKDSADLKGALKEQRLKEVIELNNSLQEMPKSFEKDLNETRETLYTPIRQRMQEAVNKVSTAYQFDYIIDSSYGTIIFARNDADDILPYVKKELGIN